MAARWASPLLARSSSSVMTTSALWLMTTPAMPTPRSWTTRPQPPVGFLARALAVFADAGFRVERLMSDNHWSYTRSLALAELPEQRGIKHVFIRPHCPWQNGKVERFNRTLQTKWAYRQPFQSNQKYSDTLAPGSTTTTMNATTPPSETNPHQLTVTNLIAEYT